MTLREAIDQGEAELAAAGSGFARLDAEILLLFALEREGDRAYLFAHAAELLDIPTAARYRELLAGRATGKPMQYITAHQEFWGLDFLVTPEVLIPRPETEHAVEAVLQLVGEQKPLRMLDVGTGSGCIAIALAHDLAYAEVTAVDVSFAALQVARKNAARNQVSVRFLESDLLSAVVDEQFDVIISNPPYVASNHPEAAQRQVLDFEPSLALFGGPTGLEIYSRLIPQAHACLPPGGHLVLEIGYSIEAPVRALLHRSQWGELRTVPDLQGIPRVVTARRR